MPARHQIDHDSTLIETIWEGNIADNTFFDALKNYLSTIKSQPDLFSYNEIVDFSSVNKVELTFKEISELANIAIKSDSPTTKTRLALVTSSKLAYSFAKMYKVYRNLMPSSNKEVDVFQSRQAALDWTKK